MITVKQNLEPIVHFRNIEDETEMRIERDKARQLLEACKTGIDRTLTHIRDNFNSHVTKNIYMTVLNFETQEDLEDYRDNPDTTIVPVESKILHPNVEKMISNVAKATDEKTKEEVEVELKAEYIAYAELLNTFVEATEKINPELFDSFNL